jgi:glyoxylase I family protein
MASQIQVGPVHHVTLTVSDVARSREFYALLGLTLTAEFGPRAVLSNGHFLLVLTPPPDASRAIPNDRFDENRIGLDHLSLSAPSRAALETAARVLDERGIPHGPITDLAAFKLYVLAFRDPDNIQVELAAPYSP